MFVCSQGGSLSWGSLSRGVSVQGVSVGGGVPVQGVSAQGGSLSERPPGRQPPPYGEERALRALRVLLECFLAKNFDIRMFAIDRSKREIMEIE